MGPWVGSILILSIVSTARDASAVQLPYLMLAGTLFVIALAFSQFRLPAVSAEGPSAGAQSAAAPARSVWSHRSLVLGAVAIFVYVGAEVAIGSFLVNFIAQEHIGAMPESRAGQYVSLYWGAAMLGRFIGSAVLR